MKVTAERAAIVLNYKVKYNYLFHAVPLLVVAAVYGASKLGRFLMVQYGACTIGRSLILR